MFGPFHVEGAPRYEVGDDIANGAMGTPYMVRCILQADDDGCFHFRTILAVPYSIPHDGHVGRMLDATGRNPWRPAHLSFVIQAPGYETLITHLFRDNSDYIDSDTVFGARHSLVRVGA